MSFNEKAGAHEPGAPASHKDTAPERQAPQVAGSASGATWQDGVLFPPGLLGDVARFIHAYAPRPVATIALATSVAFMASIIGRAYNVSGQGLNQYILVLAGTGIGKDVTGDATDKLFTSIAGMVGEEDRSAVRAFSGPGELVSQAGVLKWLARSPSCLCVLGEFGVKLKEMTVRNANPNLVGLERALLQLYSKSGQGSFYNTTAYADRDKVTPALVSPTLTLLAEAEPVRFYGLIDEAMIASGLLPRFMTFEYNGKREYLNERRQLMPSMALVLALRDLTAICLGANAQNAAHDVELDRIAAPIFRQFERSTTDDINNTQSQISKELWNRAHLKALKLAAVCAVGINPHRPLIDQDTAEWAIELIRGQTGRLIAKFDAGEIGQSATEEDRQVAELIKAITLYANCEFAKVAGYDASEPMHTAKVFTKSFLYRYLSKRAAFRNDRAGPNAALTRALKTLKESDEIRQVPNAQLVQTFGVVPEAYCIANATRFIPRPT